MSETNLINHGKDADYDEEIVLESRIMIPLRMAADFFCGVEARLPRHSPYNCALYGIQDSSHSIQRTFLYINFPFSPILICHSFYISALFPPLS